MSVAADWMRQKRPAINPLVDALDFDTRSAYVRVSKLNPGPAGEDAEMSANLAMSDHQFRAKAQDLPTSGPKAISIFPDPPDPSSFDANVTGFEEEHYGYSLHPTRYPRRAS